MKARVFTCNEKGWPYPDVQDDINKAKKQLSLSKAIAFSDSWSCATIKQIKVGDLAYFYKVGSAPRGFFAYGRVVAAEKEHQSKLNWSGFQNLSEAYTDIKNDLRVSFKWYSVVDYDKTLTPEALKSTGKFEKCNFLFRLTGGSFSENYVELLNNYWEQHVLKMVKQGHGAYTAPPNI
jgi:EVE domain